MQPCTALIPLIAEAGTLETLADECFERRRIPEALFWYERAAEAGGDLLAITQKKWQCWMLLGEFTHAWEEGDRIAALSGEVFPPVRGHVAIRCGRGLGDAIQFLRYAALLRPRCSRITVLAPPRLLPLLARFKGVDDAVSAWEPDAWPECDAEIECSHLPYLFRTTCATIPFADGYLSLDREPPPRVLAPGRERGASAGLREAPAEAVFRVGIAWAAGEWNPARSIPPSIFAALLETTGVRFVSLQRGEHAHDLPLHVTPPIRVETPESTIVDTAAAIAALDLVICVDTMIAHLAGALGRPVWVLLRYAADWRWMLDRTGSPWYSSMRLFRQRSPDDWEGLVEDVRNQLAARVDSCTRGSVKRNFEPSPGADSTQILPP
jgi:hypothetical protein